MNNIVSNVVKNFSLSKALDVAVETKSEIMRLKVRFYLKQAQNKLKEDKKRFYSDQALVAKGKRPTLPMTQSRREHVWQAEDMLEKMEALRL